MSYFEAPMPPVFLSQIRALSDEQLEQVQNFANMLVPIINKFDNSFFTLQPAHINIAATQNSITVDSEREHARSMEPALAEAFMQAAVQAGIATRAAPDDLGVAQITMNPHIAAALNQRVTAASVQHALYSAACNQIDVSALNQEELDELAQYQARNHEYLSYAE